MGFLSHVIMITKYSALRPVFLEKPEIKKNLLPLFEREAERNAKKKESLEEAHAHTHTK